MFRTKYVKVCDYTLLSPVSAHMCVLKYSICFPCSSSQKGLSEEQKQLRCQGLFDEFLQNVDVDEAVLCAQELATPGDPSHSLFQSMVFLAML